MVDYDAMMSPTERQMATAAMKQPFSRWWVYRLAGEAKVPNSSAHRVVRRWLANGIVVVKGAAAPTIPGLPARKLYELTPHGRKLLALVLAVKQ